MTDDLKSLARDVVRKNSDVGDLVDQIGDEDHLSLAGMNSGDIIRIAQRCEELLDRSLTDDELADLQCIDDVADLLRDAKVR